MAMRFPSLNGETMTRSLVFLTLAVLSCGAQSEELQCPSNIAVKETLEQSPQGWSIGNNGIPSSLARVTFFDGDPKNQASLAPDRDFKSGKDQVAVWKFGAGQGPIWLACEYLSTSITLMRELPAYRQCRVTYSVGNIVKRIDCQ